MHDEPHDWVFRRGPGFGPSFGRGPHMRKMFFRAGPGMGMGPPRRMRRGDVRFAVIDVLAEAPMHGYEIIRTLEERSGGRRQDRVELVEHHDPDALELPGADQLDQPIGGAHHQPGAPSEALPLARERR